MASNGKPPYRRTLVAKGFSEHWQTAAADNRLFRDCRRAPQDINVVRFHRPNPVSDNSRAIASPPIGPNLGNMTEGNPPTALAQEN